MADPISGVASVAGLVSLGLTVSSGVAKYANALKCHTEELESIRQRNEVLRRTIIFIDGVQSRLQLPNQQTLSIGTVDETIKACKVELDSLEALVVELAGCSTTASWRSRLRDTRRRLTYAFERSKVDQLATKLDHTIQIIQISLQGLGLDYSRLLTLKLNEINDKSCETASDVRKIFPNVQNGLGQLEGRLVASIESVKSDGAKGNQQMKEALADLESKILSQLADRLINTNSSQAASWLASKPAALRELFDETSQSRNVNLVTRSGNTDTKTLASPKDSWICACGYRRKVQKRNAPFGPFRIYNETCVRSHAPYCHLSQAKLTEQRSSKLEIHFYGLVRLMHVVLTFSFQVTSGAGGIVINQIIESAFSRNILKLARAAFECGPLTTSILADDTLQVANLIAKYPKFMQEENLVKQSPLHVAVGKPHMLSLLLTAADFLTLDKRDSGALSSFDYALWEVVKADCRSPYHTPAGVCSSGCSCSRSLDMILEAALAFPQILEPQREWGKDIGSKKAHYTYAKYMGNCYDRLLSETREALARIGIKPSTMKLTPFPGSYEAELIETIRYPATDGSPLSDRWRVWKRFYLQNDRTEPTEVLITQGVAHTGPVSDVKLLPLACNKITQHIKPPRNPEENLYSYLLKAPEPPGTDAQAGILRSHYVSFNMGAKLGLDRVYVSAPDETFFDRHLENLPSTHVADTCSCACSGHGCTQFVYFLKGLLTFLKPPRGGGPDGLSRLLAWCETMARIGARAPHQHHRTAIRFFTFETLGLTHTCCDASHVCGSERPWEPFRGNAEGVREEEEAELRELELHVEEYENDFRRKFASAGSNSAHFHQFWVEYWQLQMMEILE
ncbi:hypothetical protein PG984_000053 [Apiospora sp. TS-2023a]